ncbi:MAG: hypothetical protein ACFBSC_21810 [Microcoleaceae cyanobacterium]
METSARYLLFHGSIIFLIGLLCGVPYGQAIVKQKSDEEIRAWKLAHGALSLGATTMIAMAAILSFLEVNSLIQWLLASTFIISGYGFCAALTIEPFADDRGLSWSGTRLNKFVFAGNLVGAVSSLVGSIVLVYAAYVSL